MGEHAQIKSTINSKYTIRVRLSSLLYMSRNISMSNMLTFPQMLVREHHNLSARCMLTSGYGKITSRLEFASATIFGKRED